MEPVTVVGSGLAGYTLARELRKLDAEIPLRIVSADAGGFYSKPMLSNALAQKRTPQTLLTADADAMAAQLNAEIRARCRIVALNADDRTIVTADGERLAYAKLVLALGADALGLPLAGAPAQAIHTVNDLEDYASFRAAIEGKARIAIIGGGLIGCEFANDLAGSGFEVTVIDRGAEPLSQLVPDVIGQGLRLALETLGVRWHRKNSVVAWESAGEGARLTLGDGSLVEADVVLAATGLRPRTALAADAGLAIDRGIVVNRMLETSAPGVYALGDCAQVEGLVLPFIMPIMQAARVLARTLAGTPTPVSYPAMPVSVKTPVHPIVISPPPRGAIGAWQIAEKDGGLDARFVGAAGELLGFVLSGKATSARQSLMAQVPPVLA